MRNFLGKDPDPAQDRHGLQSIQLLLFPSLLGCSSLEPSKNSSGYSEKYPAPCLWGYSAILFQKQNPNQGHVPLLVSPHWSQDPPEGP